MTKIYFPSVLLLISTGSSAELTLQKVQKIAIQNDPWLSGNRLKEQAMVANSASVATLPDPVMSIGIANLPTDGLRFNQEAMTQLKVGLSQQFSRGDSLSLKKQQLLQMAAQNPYLRQDRAAQVKIIVAQLWLTIFTTQQRIHVVEQSRPLFVQLVDIVEAHYSSAQGITRQQDIVNAQVELARLDDRLSALVAERNASLAKLSQWLYEEGQTNAKAISLNIDVFPHNWPTLPQLDTTVHVFLQQQDRNALAQRLAQHPAILAIDQQIKSSYTAIQLAEQQYQAQWGVNASYAYRDNDPIGHNRSDFFSLGLTVDLPLFTSQKQDKDLEASRLQTESVKTDKRLAIRALLSQVQSTWQIFESINLRMSHYQKQILPQMSEQSEAALNAYTADDGVFSDVMRAKIAQLNTELEFIQLKNQHAINLIQLDYFFDQDAKYTEQMPSGVQP